MIDDSIRKTARERVLTSAQIVEKHTVHDA